MKTFFSLCLLAGLAITYSEAYCYYSTPAPILDENGIKCSIRGHAIAAGESLNNTEDCERCSCGMDGSLKCCGYGINAGLFAAPSGCKVIRAGADTCDVRMVKIEDETQDC